MSTTTTRAGFGASPVTPREVWLASLGAVVVTREWAAKEAGPLFRSLVHEGAMVETRAVRVVGDGIENSFQRANTLWRRARSTVTSTVQAYAESAVALARELPRSLPHVRLPGVPATPAAAPVKRATRTTKTTHPARKTRRAVKRAVKRG